MKNIDKEEYSFIRICCFSCDKLLQYQQIGVIKECGHTMCLKCINDLCLPIKKCSICNISLKNKKDSILKLEESGSSFSAHGQVESVSFKPVFVG